MFDEIMMSFITRKGWTVNDEGLLVITAAQAKGANIGRRLSHPELRTLLIPGLPGTTLLTENRHFIITK